MRKSTVNYIISSDLIYVNWTTANGDIINEYQEINPSDLFVL